MKRSIVRLCAVGDVCLADSAYCIGHGTRSAITRGGMERFSALLAAGLSPADLRVANLEAVHSRLGARPYRLSTLEMRGDSDHLDLMRAAQFDVVNLANNHIFQHGRAPYDDLLEQLRVRSIQVVGHDDGPGATRVVTLERGGVPFHFVGFSLRPEQYHPDQTVPYSLRRTEREVLDEVREMARGRRGHVICSLHWGHEYVETPSREQQSLARALVDAGVSLILGHHPHVLQGIEQYSRGLIAYSLGNFVFDLREPETLDTAALYVDFDADGIRGFDLEPLRIGPEFFPERPPDDRALQLRTRMAELANGLRVAVPPPAAELLPIESARSRASSYFAYRHFATNLFRYNPLLAFQSVFRAVLRRLGLAHNP